MSTKTGGVWEEALIEEMVYAIAHIAHAEQHLLEIETSIGKPTLLMIIDKLRNGRKSMGQTLFDIIGVSLEEAGEGGEFKQKAESFWCTLKHLSMALIHCDEVAEKIIKKIIVALSQNKDMSSAENLAKKLVEVYNIRKTIRDAIVDLLTKTVKSIEQAPETIRCREDLCVE